MKKGTVLLIKITDLTSLKAVNNIIKAINNISAKGIGVSNLC
jgi:hypothetical protein